MSNIDYVEIIIFNTYKITKIYINISKKKVIINDRIVDIVDDKIKELLEIIKYWDNNYQSFVMDAEKFNISLIANNKIIKTYQGDGTYPYNYNEFKRWISDIR